MRNAECGIVVSLARWFMNGASPQAPTPTGTIGSKGVWGESPIIDYRVSDTAHSAFRIPNSTLSVHILFARFFLYALRHTIYPEVIAVTAAKRQLSAAPLLTMLLLGLLLLAAGEGKALAAVLADRVTLCLQTLVPSLFGCMALCNLLQMSGCGAWLGAHMRHFARALHMPRTVTGVFLVSQLAGYPVGTILLRRMTEDGTLSRTDAARLSAVCFGGGPAFLVGLAGTQLFGSAKAGWAMLAACVTANLLLARVLCRGIPASGGEAVRQPCLTAQMLTDSAADAMQSLMQICAAVLLFGVLMMLAETLGLVTLLTALAGHFGIPAQTARALLAALTDVTQLPALFRCGLHFRVLLPLTAGLLSFGGICVHCQCLAASGGTLRLWHLLTVRLAAALLTALLTALLVPHIPLPETAAAFSAFAALSESRSPLPGILIFCTGFPFLLKKD